MPNHPDVPDIPTLQRNAARQSTSSAVLIWAPTLGILVPLNVWAAYAFSTSLLLEGYLMLFVSMMKCLAVGISMFLLFSFPASISLRLLRRRLLCEAKNHAHRLTYIFSVCRPIVTTRQSILLDMGTAAGWCGLRAEDRIFSTQCLIRRSAFRRRYQKIRSRRHICGGPACTSQRLDKPRSG